jgi:putative SOS response-associated peptidase YedK
MMPATFLPVQRCIIREVRCDGFAEKTVIIKTDSQGNEQYRLHPGQQDLFAVAGWVLPTDDGKLYYSIFRSIYNIR